MTKLRNVNFMTIAKWPVNFMTKPKQGWSIHKHFPQKCQKGRTKCRYGAPWFPCLKTIIQVPPRVKFKEKITNDKDLEDIMRGDEVELAKEIQCDVKRVLEDDEIVKEVQSYKEDEVQKYLEHRGFEQKIEMIFIDRKGIHKDKLVRTSDPEVMKDYNDHTDVKVDTFSKMTTAGLLKRQEYHRAQKNLIPLNEIKRQRLQRLLDYAGVEGDSFEEQNKNYEDALSISFEKGYSVVIKRDVDEIYTNSYNPDWIKS